MTRPALPHREAVAAYTPEYLVARLHEVLRAQLAGAKPKKTIMLRRKAEKLRAITTLLTESK